MCCCFDYGVDWDVDWFFEFVDGLLVEVVVVDFE